MKKVMHNHHILPIRLGGTNDSSNLKRVSIKEHAKLHKELWLKYNDRRDFIAWKCLSGLMSKKEMLHELYALGGYMTGKRGKGIPKTGRAAKGHKKSIETRQKMKASWPRTDSQLIKHKSRNQSGEKHWTKIHNIIPDTLKNINKRITCQVCGKTTNAGNIGRWHKH